MNSLFFKINEAAKSWEKTRDPFYKKEWYRLIKLWARLVGRPKANKK
tara:strand:- start:211 stop:351 length:141 start_codon:yes stop_codon:yes gene_type:complete